MLWKKNLFERNSGIIYLYVIVQSLYILFFQAVIIGDFLLAATKWIAIPKYSSETKALSSL